MSTRALLKKQSNPDRSEIVKAISGNLCRCTGYHSIIAAIENAAKKQPKEDL
jgi:aerobic-type carbon monoxide dehydrogenase small subunit (CoxS/CutS family)